MTRPADRGIDRGNLLLNMTANGSLGRDGENLFVVQRGEGRTSRTRTAAATSTACPACTAASSATPTPTSSPRRPPSNCASCASARCGPRPRTPRPSNWPSGWPGSHPMDIEHTFFSSGGPRRSRPPGRSPASYHALRGEPGRTKAISRRGAYHGLTIGALSLTDDPGLTEPYGPPAIETRFVSNTNRVGLPPSSPMTRSSPGTCSPSWKPRSLPRARRPSRC